MLKLVKRPDTPFWQIRGTCPYTGERIRQSTKTDSREAAAAILTAELNRRKDETLHGRAGTALFAEAVIEYLSKGGEERFLDALLDHFGQTRLRDISDQDLSGFCRSRYPGRTAATLRRQVYGPFQAVWNAAARAEMVPERTFAKPKVVRAAVQYPRSDDWLVKLVRDGLTTPQQRAAAVFMSFSGRRATEVCNVLVEHFDPVRGVIDVPHTKNGKGFTVALPPVVTGILQQLDLRDPKARLFGFSTRWSLRNAIKRGCARAGIEYFSPHKMGRHRFAARFLEHGHSVKELQLAGGWDSIGAVSVYAHIEQSQVHNSVRNMPMPDGLTSRHIGVTEAEVIDVPAIENSHE